MPTVVDDPEVWKQRADFAAQQGKYWTQVHAEALGKLPAGTTVIINVITGEYVTGAEWLATREAYEQKFGQGTTISWSFEVDRPIFVGGGLWRS